MCMSTNTWVLGPKLYDRIICLCIICTCMSVCTYPRHSRFGGTFVVANQKSIAGTERVYHRPIAGRTQGSGWEGESSAGQWGPNPVHRTVLINIPWDNYLRQDRIMSWQSKWEKLSCLAYKILLRYFSRGAAKIESAANAPLKWNCAHPSSSFPLHHPSSLLLPPPHPRFTGVLIWHGEEASTHPKTKTSCQRCAQQPAVDLQYQVTCKLMYRIMYW